MIKKVLVLAIFALYTISCSPIIIDAYIESLCPDCIEFLTETSFSTFYRALLKYPELIQVRLWPYGNAKEIKGE